MLSTLETAREKDNVNWDDATTVIYKFGIPAGIAIFLIWFLVSVISVQLQTLQIQVQTISNGLSNHALDTGYTVKAIDELKQRTYETNNLLKNICMNTAKTAYDKSACFK